MSDVFLDATIDLNMEVADSELTRVHALSSTVTTSLALTADLARVHPLTATIETSMTLGPAELLIVKTLASTIQLSLRVLAQLFYAPKIAPIPAGVEVAPILRTTAAMPAPSALDDFGRPVQPWTPS